MSTVPIPGVVPTNAGILEYVGQLEDPHAVFDFAACVAPGLQQLANTLGKDGGSLTQRLVAICEEDQERILFCMASMANQSQEQGEEVPPPAA